MNTRNSGQQPHANMRASNNTAGAGGSLAGGALAGQLSISEQAGSGGGRHARVHPHPGRVLLFLRAHNVSAPEGRLKKYALRKGKPPTEDCPILRSRRRVLHGAHCGLL